MCICALSFFLQVVKRFEIPKALYKLPIIIIIVVVVLNERRANLNTPIENRNVKRTKKNSANN